MFSVYRCCDWASDHDDLIVCFLDFGNISYNVILMIETLKKQKTEQTEHENKFLSDQ